MKAIWSLSLKRNQGNIATIPGEEDASIGEQLREAGRRGQLPPCVWFKSRPHKTNGVSYKRRKNNRCHILGVLGRGEGEKGLLFFARGSARGFWIIHLLDDYFRSRPLLVPYGRLYKVTGMHCFFHRKPRERRN